MSYKIVSDSSCNNLVKRDEHFATAPMHIRIGDADWPDVPGVDLDEFLDAMATTKEKTSSSCPAPGEWLEAFGDADLIYCLTLTYSLSGSYNSALSAKQMYEEAHPGRKVYVVDSFATGPRMIFLIDRMRKNLEAGMDPDDVYKDIIEYRVSTDLLFCLKSVKNFVGNGRMSGLLAKTIGILGMHFTGTANAEGKLQLLGKTRGDSKTINFVYKQMLERGYNGSPVVISHVNNLDAANELADLIDADFHNRDQISFELTTLLCSYYAERGGFLVGYERTPDEETLTQTTSFLGKLKSLAHLG